MKTTIIQIGKVLILIVIAIPIIAVILPQPRENARRVACSNTLSALAKASQMYALDHDGIYPCNWQAIANIFSTPKLFVCRSKLKNQIPETIDNVDKWSDFILIPRVTTNDPINTIFAFEPLKNHGNKGANVVDRNGEVHWVKADEFQKLKAKDGKTLTSFCR